MSLLSWRTFVNKTGVVYDPTKTSVVFAEDLNKIADALVTGSSEVLITPYNVDTSTRDSLTAFQGMVVFNTDVNKLQVFNGSAWEDIGTDYVDELVKVSNSDTTPGYLIDKVVVNAPLTYSVVNSGGDEDFSISLNVDNATIEVDSVNGFLKVKDGVFASLTHTHTASEISDWSSAFDSSFSGKTTDDLSEGTTNFYYTTTRFNNDFANKTTDDLAEGSNNLYFTDARVSSNADVSANTTHRNTTGNPHNTTLGDLSDVSIVLPASGQGLVFDGSAWKNTDVATQTELDNHVNDTSNPHGVTASQVGAIPSSEKGVPNGVATLDSTGKVYASQLPSYVDDVLEYDTLADFPSTGETGKIYVAKDTNKTYRWSGSSYVEISPSLALGTTHDTAFYGDYGQIAYDHSQITSGNPHGVTASDVGINSSDDVPEGTTNLYFSGKTTDDLPEGTSNKYDKTVTFTGGTNVTITGSYPDFTISDNSASAVHTHNSDEVTISNFNSASYTTLKDYVNTIQSAGKISGGEISDNGDGTVSVSGGSGFIKVADDDLAETKFFDWTGNSSVSLTDNSPNFIIVDYNSGSPVISVETSLPSDHNTKILLGEVYKEGTELYIVTAGQVITNYDKKTFWKDLEINGKFQRANGLKISETGTLNFAITSGIVYSGLTKTNLDSFDSSAGDTFTYFYRDGAGGWTKVTGQTQIDNQHYDDGSGTLAELDDALGWRPADYGVHWVYEDIEGHVYVIYGRGSYTLTEAQEAEPPSDTPKVISEVGGLVGKIIVQKDASSFTSVQSAFDNYFIPIGVSDHNNLSGLQGGTTDEYYHLTEGAYNNLKDQDQLVTTTASPSFSSLTVNGLGEIKAADAGSNTNFLQLTPTNYGAGNPKLYVKATDTNDKWTIGISDGVDNSGTINFYSGKLTHNDNEIVSVGSQYDLTTTLHFACDWQTEDNWNYYFDGSGYNSFAILNNRFYTGTTSGSTAGAYLNFIPNWNLSHNNNLLFARIQRGGSAGIDSSTEIIFGSFDFSGATVPPSLTHRHVGWHVVGFTIYASFSDGTTHTDVDTGYAYDCSAWCNRDLMIKVEDDTIKWLISGATVHTEPITSVGSYTNSQLWFSIKNGTTNNNNVFLPYIFVKLRNVF